MKVKIKSLTDTYEVILPGDSRILPACKTLNNFKNYYLLFAPDNELAHTHHTTVPAYWVQKDLCEITARDSVLFKNVKIGQRFRHKYNRHDYILEVTALFDNNNAIFITKVVRDLKEIFPVGKEEKWELAINSFTFLSNQDAPPP